MRMFKKDDKAVSPVIAIILMVAITVVLAGVLYVWVIGFRTGGTAGTTVDGTYTDGPGPVTNRLWKFRIAETSTDVKISDCKIVLESDGVPMAEADMAGATPSAAGLGTEHKVALGEGNITILDATNDTKLNSGDVITIDPTANQWQPGWDLVLRVKGKPAMTKELRS